MQTTTIFSIIDCNDLANIIFNQLDVATIAAVAPVCKRFTELSNEHYETRLNKDILLPSKELYDNFYEKTLKLYNSKKDRYLLQFTGQIRNFKKMLYEFEIFIEPFVKNNYWLLFVNDLDIMEKMFLFVSRISEMIENQDHIFFNTNVSQDDKDLYFRLQNIFDILDNYMYVEYPDRYINIELHRMAKFKKIKKQYKMKRYYLIKALKRPNDESYYISSNESSSC